MRRSSQTETVGLLLILMKKDLRSVPRGSSDKGHLPEGLEREGEREGGGREGERDRGGGRENPGLGGHILLTQEWPSGF